MKQLRSLTMQIDRRSALQNFFLLTAGGLIMAINLNLFLVPSELAPGGVSGAAIIINKFTAWPIGLMMGP
ncbi:MAG: YitT family protein [Anaerolineales bacterium]|jgi:uncharacterized membrane-anchored protein YitT (DUF2179 family)